MRTNLRAFAKSGFLLLALSSIVSNGNLGAASRPQSSPADAAGEERYRHFALLHEGDTQRGKDLFASEQKVGCSKCHTVDGTAGKAGPDLLAIGDKFGRRELIDSILMPSAIIAVGYSMATVETKSGEEYTGIVKEATDDWLELMGIDARRVRIATRDIEKRLTSEISLMPQGLQAGLSLEEFTDLIEYLVSLKQPENTTMLHQ